MISSGPNHGRDLICGIVRAFGGDVCEFEAEIAANVDLVSSLVEAARRGEDHAYPTAIVLPVGAGPPAWRWVDALGWRPIAPETKALPYAPDDATFKRIATAAWRRFADYAVAGVAYHF